MTRNIKQSRCEVNSEKKHKFKRLHSVHSCAGEEDGYQQCDMKA